MTYRFFKYYQEFLRRRPYLVQAIQTGGLMATGDVISQVIIEKTYWRDTDIQRTLKFGSIGFFIGVSIYALLKGYILGYQRIFEHQLKNKLSVLAITPYNIRLGIK